MVIFTWPAPNKTVVMDPVVDAIISSFLRASYSLSIPVLGFWPPACSAAFDFTLTPQTSGLMLLPLCWHLALLLGMGLLGLSANSPTWFSLAPETSAQGHPLCSYATRFDMALSSEARPHWRPEMKKSLLVCRVSCCSLDEISFISLNTNVNYLHT